MYLFLQFLSNFCCCGRSSKEQKNFSTYENFADCEISQPRIFATIAKFSNRLVADCMEGSHKKTKHA